MATQTLNTITISPKQQRPAMLPMSGTDPQGNTIQVDQVSLRMNGRPWIPVMGEFHFSRYPANEWEDALLKMKAGGITVVATYIFWIHVEESEGHFCWSGNNNLRYFIQLCQKVGLYAYPRLGPWAHGECRNGGFPDWLLEKCQENVRTDAHPYLDYAQRLYQQIADQCKGLLWKDGGPIIGIQLENELLNNAAHILTLKQMAQAAGFDVPLYTMTGWGPAETPTTGDVIPVFGGYPDAFWDRHVDSWSTNSRKHYFFSALRDDNTIGADLAKRAEVADLAYLEKFPFGTCETGGGMQISYHRRPLIQPDDIAALALVKIGNGSNLQGYYMYHGGSNPTGLYSTMQESQDTHYPNDLPVIDYDFQAPLGEYGQAREHYHLLRRLHLFLADYGPQLALQASFLPDQRPLSLDDQSTLRWCMRSDATSGYLFVNNYQRMGNLPTHPQVQFCVDLPQKSILLPSQPVDIPGGAYFIWPVQLDLAGINLIYATAQPVCQMVCDDTQYHVFSAISSIPVEFVLDSEKIESVSLTNGETITQPGNALLFIRKLVPGLDCQIQIIGKDGQKITILLLTDQQTRHLYKVQTWEKEYLWIANGSIFARPEQIRFQTDQPGEQKISVFPKPPIFDQNGQPVSYAQDGLFTQFCVSFTPTAPTIELSQRKNAGVGRKIQNGPAGVAQAPSETDFSSAAEWIIRVADYTRIDGQHWMLKIDYTGDSARAYTQGQLVEDDFFCGRPWEIGITRFTHQIDEQGLVIKILPFQKNAPVYLSEEIRSQLKDCDNIARINSVSVSTIYEARFERTR